VAFHWQHGWHFERQDNGDVRVTLRKPVQEEAFSDHTLVTRGHQSHPAKVESDDDFLSIGTPFVVLQDFTIPATDWQSIVASVCPDGGSGPTYQAVAGLHAGVR
jgi:hypothetical protein